MTSPTLLLIATAAASPATVGEAWVLAPTPDDRAALRELPVGFGEGIDGDWVRVMGTEAQLSAVRQAGLPVRDETRDHRLAASAVYHSPDAMNAALEELAEAHPDRTELVQVGESVNGRPLLALRIGTSGGASWRVLGGHHGDESSSYEVALAIAEELLTDDARHGELLDQDEVWVWPQVNPDGVATGSRYNARGVDLNRNYSYLWNPDEYQPGEFAFSEPETRAVRTLSTYESFHAGLSLHSGATNIGYVWNSGYDPTVEEPRLIELAQVYDDACKQPGFYATNGADWYITYGDTNDWSFAMQGTLDFTVEVSVPKSPTEEELAAVLSAHVQTAADWLHTPATLRGRVTDDASGLPIPASLELLLHTAVFDTDPADGTYARIVEPGTWGLVVSAPGYADSVYRLSLHGDPVFLETSLMREGLVSLRPEPGLLSRGDEPPSFTLPGLATPPAELTLSRPGFDSVQVEASAGSYTPDLDQLAPGPWTLELDGQVAPRSLWIGAEDDRVRLLDAQRIGARLDVTGENLARGSRAFALVGIERALVALPVLAEQPDRLELDISQVPVEAGVDLLVVSNGAELGLLEVFGDVGVDTGAPEDTGEGPPDVKDTGPGNPLAQDDAQLTACGCSQVPPSGPSTLLLLALTAVISTRRRP